MEQYANKNNDSGISSYQIGNDYIWVGFKQGGVYEYTHASAGAANVEKMTSLARSGSGLNSFINTYVKNRYFRKIR